MTEGQSSMALPSLLSIYHRLPGPLRSGAVASRGYYLRFWRYGRQTDALVAAALERDGWSPAQWEAWRAERLSRTLHRAATAVPFYRELWRRRRLAGDRASAEYLENWPVLKKETVRRQPRAFLADDCNPRTMFSEHTSGTTGTPLTLWSSRETVRAWYALWEARLRVWNGVSRRDRWAMIGGQLVTPVNRTRPPYWVWNPGLRQLYLSSYHLSPATIGDYVNALRRYRPRYVIGYASSLHSLARLAAEQSLEIGPFAVAISNAEPLLAHQRDQIAEGLRCPVRDTYGMCEIACAGSECEAGVMHLWPDVGLLEVLSDATDEAAEPGAIGRLVATGLLNRDMPLIRYDTGDRGALDPAPIDCACGRRLPAIRALDGRSDDVIVSPSGRRIGRLDPVFKGGLRIHEAQIVHESAGLLRVLVVPAEGYTERDAAMIAGRLRDRVGTEFEIVVERVDAIARTAAGKFRAVISRVASGEATRS